jgi:hypothetical protein
LRAGHGRTQHALNDRIRLIDRSIRSVHDQPVSVDAKGDRKRVLDRRKILIELSEKPEVIVKVA